MQNIQLFGSKHFRMHKVGWQAEPGRAVAGFTRASYVMRWEKLSKDHISGRHISSDPEEICPVWASEASQAVIKPRQIAIWPLLVPLQQGRGMWEKLSKEHISGLHITLPAD